jgi:hypothetical protein
MESCGEKVNMQERIKEEAETYITHLAEDSTTTTTDTQHRTRRQSVSRGIMRRVLKDAKAQQIRRRGRGRRTRHERK